MGSPVIIRGTVLEGENFTLVALVTGPDGSQLGTDTGVSPSTVTESLYDITETGDPSNSVFTDSALVMTDVFTTTAAGALTNDGWWDLDDDGYNWRRTVGGSSGIIGLEGGHRYRIEYNFTTTSWGKIYVVAEILCKSVLS